jgi:hypothetical protein
VFCSLAKILGVGQKCTYWDILEDRGEPLCFVVGPKGSGKTTFSLKYAAIYGVKEAGLLCTTVYLQPAHLTPFKENKNPSQLTQLIREEIETRYGTKFGKLDMHLSLVLDVERAPELDRHFEDRQEVSGIIRELQKLAKNVRLVLCGTGLKPFESFSSNRDPQCFRMKDMEEFDRSILLTKYSL